MGRLIDEDELLTRIRLNYNNHQNVNAGAIKDIINTTRTAYDVEKVVKEMDLHAVNDPRSFYPVRNIDFGWAVDIVRRGGIK